MKDHTVYLEHLWLCPRKIISILSRVTPHHIHHQFHRFSTSLCHQLNSLIIFAWREKKSLFWFLHLIIDQMSGKVPASLFNWEDLLFSASLAFFSFFPSEQASGQTDRRAWAYCNQNQSYRNLPSTLYLHLSLRSIRHSLNPSPRIRKAIVHTRLKRIIVSFKTRVKKKRKLTRTSSMRAHE